MRFPSLSLGSTRCFFGTILAVTALSLLPGCAALQQVAALKNVDFSIAGIADPFVAGIDLNSVRSFDDVGLLDTARITAAVVRGELPARFVVHVSAENPSDNSVAARLLGMDWSLFLNDTETVSGTFNDPRDLPPGIPVDIPIAVELDLLKFFSQSAPDLVNLVLGLAGAGGDGAQIRLVARPTVNTPIGPIQYPQPITVVNRQVGR